MSIGILNEGPLHAALKATYVANGGEAEVKVEGFVADAVRNGVVYEIQTGSFSGLNRKLTHLANLGPVVLVHPISGTKKIIKQPEDASKKVTMRKSPKRGALVHIVNELVYIPSLLNHPNFAVEVVLTDEHELRRYDKKMNRRRGGWRVIERRLQHVVDACRLNQMSDLFEFLVSELEEPFGTSELAVALDQPQDIAQKMAYCLRHSGVTEICGKNGNALQYRTTLG